MARLFVTPRELNFIADITKEYVKDIIGQFIYYYPISELKTLNHDIYNESVEKVFDNPIKIEAHVGQPVQSNTTGKIGFEQNWTLEVFIQHRDILDKGVSVSVGDFFTYGPVTYEIVGSDFVRNIFGQVEHIDGIKITGQNVRESQFKVPKIGGPLGREYEDSDAVQDEFVQQRGFENNRLGPTADQRDLQKSGVLTEPLSGPAEVSGGGDPDDVGSAFYAEDE